MKDSIDNALKQCKAKGWENIWFGSEISILVVGLLGNTLLLSWFVRERKSLSASQVLGLNLVVMDFFFLSIMPFSLTLQMPASNTNSTNERNAIDWAKDVFDIFNLIGCPLLLTCMCVERYLAVMRPILYLRLRKWEYRIAVSAIVWLITFGFCLSEGLTKSDKTRIIYVSIVISILFCVMLACFGGIVWSLKQQSPAHTNLGPQRPSERPLRRQAMNNVLVVLVAAVLSYLPVLLILPVLLFSFYSSYLITEVVCKLLEVSLLCPMFGVLIAPLFYLSKARKICC